VHAPAFEVSDVARHLRPAYVACDQNTITVGLQRSMDARICDRGMSPEHVFDLRRFDAVAANFYLIVDASQRDEQPVCAASSKVARAVEDASRMQRVRLERALICLIGVPVTNRSMCTANRQLSAYRILVPIFVQEERLDIAHRKSDWYLSTPTASVDDVAQREAVFRCAVEVVQ